MPDVTLMKLNDVSNQTSELKRVTKITESTVIKVVPRLSSPYLSV